MGQSSDYSENLHSNRKRWIAGSVIFLVFAAIGLFIVKWNPYFHKSFVAATNHSIGSSIISGDSATGPEPSFAAAWHYSLVYFKSIWQAFVVGIVLASLVQVLVPRDWIQRILGKTSYGSTLVAGVTALPGMM